MSTASGTSGRLPLSLEVLCVLLLISRFPIPRSVDFLSFWILDLFLGPLFCIFAYSQKHDSSAPGGDFIKFYIKGTMWWSGVFLSLCLIGFRIQDLFTLSLESLRQNLSEVVLSDDKVTAFCLVGLDRLKFLSRIGRLTAIVFPSLGFYYYVASLISCYKYFKNRKSLSA